MKNSALHKKGKELIAMGESLCEMAGGDEDGSDTQYDSDDDDMPSGTDKESKKKMSVALLSKAFGKGE